MSYRYNLEGIADLSSVFSLGQIDCSSNVNGQVQFEPLFEQVKVLGHPRILLTIMLTDTAEKALRMLRILELGTSIGVVGMQPKIVRDLFVSICGKENIPSHIMWLNDLTASGNRTACWIPMKAALEQLVWVDNMAPSKPGPACWEVPTGRFRLPKMSIAGTRTESTIPTISGYYPNWAFEDPAD